MHFIYRNKTKEMSYDSNLTHNSVVITFVSESAHLVIYGRNQIR